MKLDLQVRDLKTGARAQKAFASVDEAKAWLKDRPKFSEVLGVASHHVPPDVNDALKACLRPLDEEEKLLVRQLEQALEVELRKQAEARQKKEAAEAAKHREEMASADPNRPLELRFLHNTGLGNANAADERPITDAAREAAMAWIEERNDWVRDRNQVVGDARLQVWPNAIPDDAGDDRVISGTFVPVTAPKAN